MKKISIIIPCYNGGNFVDKAICSVLNQESDSLDKEILVINDGSNDNSAEIVERFAKEHKEIRLINQHNQGISAARNTGIRNATGDYILFLDADDFISPDCLGRLCAETERHNADILLFGTRFAKPSDFSQITPPEFNIFYELNPIDYFKRTRAYDVNGAVWREIFRRDFIVKNNLKFNTDIKFSEDNLFMMEALSCCGKMIETKTICHHYVMHGDNTIKIVASSEWDKLIEMDLSRIKEIMKFYQSDKADLNNKGLTNAIEFTVFLYAFEALKKVLKSHGGRDEMKSVIDQLNNMGSYPLKRLSCFREYGMANVLKIRMEWSLLRHKYPALITASLTQLYNTLKKK